MVSYDNEDAIVVTEPNQTEVSPTDETIEGNRGVSGPIVNNEGGTSETPSNLVNNNLDNLVSKEELNEILQYKQNGNVNESKLSPNPAGFGFNKQEFVDYLPPISNGEPNVLYIVKVKNNGLIVGYRLYKYVPIGNGQNAHYEQFGATPDLKLEKGEQAQVARVVNAPREGLEKVFNGDVAFNGNVYLKGRLFAPNSDDEPGDIDGIDSIEFKSVHLVKATVGYVANLSVTEEQWEKATSHQNYPVARFQLVSGEILELPRVYYNSSISTVAFGGKVGDTVYYAVLGNSVTLQGQLYEWDEDLDEINEVPPSGTETVDLNIFKYKDEWYHIVTAYELANSPSGTAVQLLGVDSDGDIVRGAIPAGGVVDGSLSTSSENPVQNKVVTAALAEKADKTELEDYARVDGNYPTLTAGVADNLSPYDETSGVNQHAPFNFQASGTNNGSDPTTAVGELALLQEKRGNTVVVNQLAKELNATNWMTNNATVTFNNGVATFTATAQGGYVYNITSYTFISGHKYLYHFDIKLSSASSLVKARLYDDYTNFINYDVPQNTNQQSIFVLGTCSNTSTGSIAFVDQAASDWASFEIKNITVIDLTQWFNGDIPSDLLSHPENFFRYYQGSLAYNEGTLVNANGRYLKAIGRNQWDEEYGEYHWIGGTRQAYSGGFGCKNPIRVIPNATYYFKRPEVVAGFVFLDKDNNLVGANENYLNTTDHRFTVPSNALYMCFWLNNYGSTYNHDITISIEYEGESGYDQYYPYELLTNNDTGTETLRSAGNAHDVKLPSGEIKRDIGVVDLGSLDWTLQDYGTGKLFASSDLSIPHKATVWDIVPNLLCSKYSTQAYTILYGGAQGISTYTSTNTTTIMINDTNYNDGASLKAALNGVYLFYELAEPTTEQGTPYSENIAIDDFGSMSFEGTSGVPQGNLIFYPVDYKAYLDTLHKYSDGDPDNLALKSDLPTAPQTWAESLQGYDATKTQTLKNVEGTLTWVDDE